MKAKNIVVLFSLVFAMIATSSPAFAASISTRSASIAPQQYTIRYIDDHGNIISTWKGSQVEANKRAASFRNQFFSEHPSYAAAKAGIHPDINRISPCSTPNSYFDVFNYPPLVCFANSGSVSVGISDFYEVDSGNNAGYYTYRVHSPSLPINQSFPKYNRDVCLNANGTTCTWFVMSYIDIY